MVFFRSTAVRFNGTECPSRGNDPDDLKPTLYATLYSSFMLAAKCMTLKHAYNSIVCSGSRHTKPLLVTHCIVLPFGEFNDMILESVYFLKVSSNFAMITNSVS